MRAAMLGTALAACCLACAAQVATLPSQVVGIPAQAWRQVATGAGAGPNVYIGDQTLAPEGDAVRAWTLWTYGEPRSDFGTPYQSLKVLYLFDCKAMTLVSQRTLYFDDPLGQGKLVDSRARPDGPLPFAAAQPGSIGSRLLAQACRGR